MRTFELQSRVMEQKIHRNSRFYWKGVYYDASSWPDFVIAHPEAFSAAWETAVREIVLRWISSEDGMVVHSSGSTGPPKQIRILKRYMTQSAKMTARYFQFYEGTRAMICLPARYIAGMMMIIRTMVNGWTLYFQKPSSAPAIERCYDFVPVTAMQAAHLLEIPGALDKTGTLLLGGGIVPPLIEKRLKETGHSRIFHSYGMTETATHVAMRRISTGQDTAVFEALPHIRWTEDRHSCLVIHAPQLGYNALSTNDVVELIDAHHFRWKGRRDHVINSGGIKLFPEEIERKINTVMTVPYFIAGLPDPRLGQRCVLIVEGEEYPDVEALRAAFINLLEKYERPKAFYLVPQFVRTSSGKIARPQTLKLLSHE